MVRIIILFCFVICSCSSKQNYYSVRFKNYAALAGYMLEYSLTEKGSTVYRDCDFEGCKRKMVYKRQLSQSESNSFYAHLISLNTDTLKEKYENIYMDDGFQMEIFLRGKNIHSKDIYISNVEVPSVVSLMKAIDLLVLDKRYRWAGQ
jgi:hypothetical protein